MACFARHYEQDQAVSTPLCLDCYDHAAQVVWNHHKGELWRRTRIAIERFLKRRAKQRGVDPATVKFAYGRAAEFQRRAVLAHGPSVGQDDEKWARPFENLQQV